MPEIRSVDKVTPIILVGTKLDLAREVRQSVLNSGQVGRDRHVRREEAEKVVKQLKLVTYLDCSATTQKGLKAVFDEAIINAIDPVQEKGRKCNIL